MSTGGTSMSKIPKSCHFLLSSRKNAQVFQKTTCHFEVTAIHRFLSNMDANTTGSANSWTRAKFLKKGRVLLGRSAMHPKDKSLNSNKESCI